MPALHGHGSRMAQGLPEQPLHAGSAQDGGRCRDVMPVLVAVVVVAVVVVV